MTIKSTHNDDRLSLPNNQISSKSWGIFFAFFLIISSLVVYYFSEIKKDIKLLEQINIIWLLIALVGQFLTYLFTALIYRQLLIAQKTPQLPPLMDILKASIVSLFFNQTLPSAGISGNTFFTNYLARLNVRVTQILTLIIAELLIFYTAMVAIILSLLGGCLFFYKASQVFTVTLLLGTIVYIIFGILIALSGRKNFIEKAFKYIGKIKFLKNKIDQLIRKFEQQGVSKNDLRLSEFLTQNRPAVLKAFLFQLCVVAADSFTLFALFYGLGVHVSIFIVLLSLISTKIISLLPFLPGALILYESSMSFFLVKLGIPLATAIMVTLVYRLLSFWFPMPLGLFFYRRWLKRSE